jgi:hypothetical protein
MRPSFCESASLRFVLEVFAPGPDKIKQRERDEARAHAYFCANGNSSLHALVLACLPHA